MPFIPPLETKSPEVVVVPVTPSVPPMEALPLESMVVFVVSTPVPDAVEI